MFRSDTKQVSKFQKHLTLLRMQNVPRIVVSITKTIILKMIGVLLRNWILNKAMVFLPHKNFIIFFEQKMQFFHAFRTLYTSFLTLYYTVFPY